MKTLIPFMLLVCAVVGAAAQTQHHDYTTYCFDEPVRAVSHGCVRVEKPLELARALFGDGPKYDLVQKDYAADKPDPTDIALPARVPVYITYVTCWPDSSGVIQYRRDVHT